MGVKFEAKHYNLLGLLISSRIFLFPSETMHLDCKETPLGENLAVRNNFGSRENKEAIFFVSVSR